jgi:hypothetical protein
VANDAMLLYGEGAWGDGTSALYPTLSDNLFGAELSAEYKDEDDRQGYINLLLGSTYTFEIGPTLAVEYLYYGQGYDTKQAQDFTTLRNRAKDAFIAKNYATSAAVQTLSRTADPGLRFLRRNYLMVHLQQSDVRDMLDYALRWTQNLDDGSRQVSFTADFYATDQITLFGVCTLGFGSTNTEFASFLSRYAMLGIEYGF